jgi:hypothetical protein
MEIKYTIQGYLIYTTIAAYILALLLYILRKPKTGQLLYLLGFIAAVISFGYRWYHTGHVPLQNLFEVFLSLGIIYPVSLFSRHILPVLYLTPNRRNCLPPCKAGSSPRTLLSICFRIFLWPRPHINQPYSLQAGA